jgi:hypothetical protein
MGRVIVNDSGLIEGGLDWLSDDWLLIECY